MEIDKPKVTNQWCKRNLKSAKELQLKIGSYPSAPYLCRNFLFRSGPNSFRTTKFNASQPMPDPNRAKVGPIPMRSCPGVLCSHIFASAEDANPPPSRE